MATNPFEMPLSRDIKNNLIDMESKCFLKNQVPNIDTELGQEPLHGFHKCGESEGGGFDQALILQQG